MKKIILFLFSVLALVACKQQEKKEGDRFDEALGLYEATVLKAAEAMRTNQDPPEILETFQNLVPILEEIDSIGTDDQKTRMHKIGQQLMFAVQTGGQLPVDDEDKVHKHSPNLDIEVEHHIDPFSIGGGQKQ